MTEGRLQIPKNNEVLFIEAGAVKLGELRFSLTYVRLLMCGPILAGAERSCEIDHSVMHMDMLKLRKLANIVLRVRHPLQPKHDSRQPDLHGDL